MIELKKISAGYDGVNRIECIDLCLTPGSFTAVIGPNGCGKTTLLRVMARLLPAYSGEIKIGGKPASEYEPKAFAKLVSILPQSRDIPDITVEGLVAHGRFPYLSFPRRLGPQDQDAVERALEITGTAAYRSRYLRQLSGGERQKAYIAMIVAQDAKIVLLDEPTTHLDIGRRFEVLELAHILHRTGKTVVLVLHDIAEALEWCPDIVVMEKGRIRAQGSPKTVFDSGTLNQVFCVRSQKIGGHYFFQSLSSSFKSL